MAEKPGVKFSRASSRNGCSLCVGWSGREWRSFMAKAAVHTTPTPLHVKSGVTLGEPIGRSTGATGEDHFVENILLNLPKILFGYNGQTLTPAGWGASPALRQAAEVQL